MVAMRCIELQTDGHPAFIGLDIFKVMGQVRSDCLKMFASTVGDADKDKGQVSNNLLDRVKASAGPDGINWGYMAGGWL